MLQQLSIKNIALIEELSIEFESGFNVLSGETGAGKSIIIDSLNLVLGERADKELVRSGTQKARVEGIFSVNESICELLDEAGIECEDGLLIISREISVDGKSVCRMNGSAVTLSCLKKVADKLADIHGQHEHQTLLNKDSHLAFLDSFAGHAVREQKENVKRAYAYYKACREKLNGDWGTQEERTRRMEMLEYQMHEIEEAEIVPGQEEELRQRREVLLHADKIISVLAQTQHMLRDNALDAVRGASGSLEDIADKGEKYSLLSQRLESAFYELEDIAQELELTADTVEADPYELERIEDRLAQLKKLYRKYGSEEESVLKYLDDALAEAERLQNAEETIAELERQEAQFKAEYDRQAEILSALRHDAAIAFEDRLQSELGQLGMKNATLEVEFSEESVFLPEGKDQVEFLFSANAGEPVKPLSKIISGGEMSRFMLAMKSVAADDVMLPTMVFDEIDTGISGQGAQVVAQKIAGLARNHQVIAITHLPQLASMADCHFLIRKNSDGIRTKTNVVKMDDRQRTSEIARLSGGAETSLALERAAEILAQARAFKEKTEY